MGKSPYFDDSAFFICQQYVKGVTKYNKSWFQHMLIEPKCVKNINKWIDQL